MIVGCERCSTQFQLDDSRVPPDGVKVRCSRCKHSFEVRPEGAVPAAEAPDDDPLHAIAERTAATDGIPDVTEDAPEASEPDPTPDPTVEDEEPSWEFGDGFDDLGAEPGDSSGDASGVLGGRVSSAAEEAGSGLELAGDRPAPRDSGEPGRGDDLPLGRKAPDASAKAAASAALDSGARDAAAQDSTSAPAGSDDLGSPMDWDLFDEAPASDEAGVPALAEAGTFSIETPSGPPLLAPEPAQVDDAELDARQVWVRRAGTAAGWLATAGLCVAGVLQGLWPEPLQGPAAESAGEGWALEELEGRWIDHLSRGPVFAVSGKVRNTAASTRALPALEVVWRDRSGAAVGRPTPLGVPRSEAALREAPLDAGPRSPLAGTTLRPDGGVPFLAVAENLPYAARHFEVRPRRAETAAAN